jgi:hypothetical protein
MPPRFGSFIADSKSRGTSPGTRMELLTKFCWPLTLCACRQIGDVIQVNSVEHLTPPYVTGNDGGRSA